MIIWTKIEKYTNIFNLGGNDCSPFLTDVVGYNKIENKIFITQFHHWSKYTGRFIKPVTHFSLINTPSQ